MPDRRRYERTPDTVTVLTALAVSGVAMSFLGVAPPSVLKYVPGGTALAWSMVLALSAAVTLVGVFWRTPATGWVVELAGRVGLAFACAPYFLALIATASRDIGASLVAGLLGALVVSSIVRVVQLSLRVYRWRKDTRTLIDGAAS